jgi:hypothetical protein
LDSAFFEVKTQPFANAPFHAALFTPRLGWSVKAEMSRNISHKQKIDALNNHPTSARHAAQRPHSRNPPVDPKMANSKRH